MAVAVHVGTPERTRSNNVLKFVRVRRTGSVGNGYVHISIHPDRVAITDEAIRIAAKQGGWPDVNLSEILIDLIIQHARHLVAENPALYYSAKQDGPMLHLLEDD